jgi:hypothetical protein
MTREQRLRDLVAEWNSIGDEYGPNFDRNGVNIFCSDELEAILKEGSEEWLPKRLMEYEGNEYARGWNCCLETIRDSISKQMPNGVAK